MVWNNIIVMSLVYLRTSDDNVLLGLKLKGHGVGFWNGVGGKREEGESAWRCAVRETLEETGYAVDKGGMDKIAVLMFHMEHATMLVHVFEARNFYKVAEPTSDELELKWFPISDLPIELMWPDDEHWLEMALSGTKLVGSFQYKALHGDDEPETLTSWMVVPVKEFVEPNKDS